MLSNKMTALEILKSYSPALHGDLKRKLAPPDAEHIAELFLVAEKQGANAEHELSRIEGASFNPKLARVLQLLISEPDCQLSQLKMAISCLIRTTTNDNLAEEASKYGADCERITSIIKKICSASLPPAKFEEEIKIENTLLALPEADFQNVLWAILLDFLRHLHMNKMPQSLKEQILLKIASLLKKQALENSSRLFQLCLSHHKKMQQIIMGVDLDS